MAKMTLKEMILEGDYLGSGSIVGEIFIDMAEHATRYSNGKVLRGMKSPGFGNLYEILDLKDRASFDPNNRKATLEVEYLNNPGKTVDLYLEEQFDDLLADDSDVRKAKTVSADSAKKSSDRR